MSRPRTRLVALAGGLALSLSLAAAPVAMAQDGPEAAVEDLLAAMEAKDFEALPSFFCEEHSDQLGTLDPEAMSEGLPPGMDINMLFDAFIIDTEVISTEVVSQSEDEAVVRLEGSMSMDVNADALVPFIEALLEASGMDVTEESVTMFTDLMMSEFQAETTDILEEITLVPGETRPWLICSELGSISDEEMAEDDMADDGMTEDDMSDDSMAEDSMAEETEAPEGE